MRAVHEPVDLAHLARYTGGDARLDAQVLSLFVRQSVEALARLRALCVAPQRKTWRDSLHTLKGSAMGIGAVALAEQLAAAESIDPETAPAKAVAALEAIERVSGLVNTFVAAYLAQ